MSSCHYITVKKLYDPGLSILQELSKKYVKKLYDPGLSILQELSKKYVKKIEKEKKVGLSNNISRSLQS